MRSHLLLNPHQTARERKIYIIYKMVFRDLLQRKKSEDVERKKTHQRTTTTKNNIGRQKATTNTVKVSISFVTKMTPNIWYCCKCSKTQNHLKQIWIYAKNLLNIWNKNLREIFSTGIVFFLFERLVGFGEMLSWALTVYCWWTTIF